MKQSEISDRGLVRLLPATYHKPPALRGLVDTDDEMDILAEIEGLTSGRLLAERGRNPHLDPRELAWQRRSRDLRIYGDSHVNAAFTYTRAGGNRFNTEERGASAGLITNDSVVHRVASCVSVTSIIGYF